MLRRFQADFAIFKLIEAGRRAVQNEVDVAKFLSGGDGEDVFLGSVIVCRIVLMPELVKTRQVDRRVQGPNTRTSLKGLINSFHLKGVLAGSDWNFVIADQGGIPTTERAAICIGAGNRLAGIAGKFETGDGGECNAF